jgi:hypothetical protein
MNGTVADTTSQRDGHSVYERSSFLHLKQRHKKKQQNIVTINYAAAKNWWLTLSDSFLFILVLFIIPQRFVYFTTSKNLFVVAIAVVNKLMTSNFPLTRNFTHTEKNLSKSMQLADL